MKNILKLSILLFVLFIASCACPECFNFPEPVRIIYVNNNGENLLSTGAVNPQSAVFCNSSLNIPFEIKDYVIKGSKEKTHLEFANELLQDKCVNNECCLIIKFKQMRTDTLIYQIKKATTKCCTSYPVKKFIYNGIDLLGNTENSIGAYIVTKTK